MECTSGSFPVQTDDTERQLKMDWCAWFLKVAIVPIELKQKDPTVGVRSSPPGDNDRPMYDLFMRDAKRRSSNDGDRLALARAIALHDALTLLKVMLSVEKNDNLREVFARALPPIIQAIQHDDYLLRFLTRPLIRILKESLNAMPVSAPHSKQEYVNASESDSESAKFAQTLHDAFLTSVLHLLTAVFQYLLGYVDRGGSKTYSSGAFDFRDTFVALVLFQGAYVWIKFRQAARRGSCKRKAPEAVEHEGVDHVEPCNLKPGIYARPIREKSSGAILRFKYEPRFTPRRQEGDDGSDNCSKRLPLGEYHTRDEAQIVLQIARYYYDRDIGCVEFDDGRYKVLIPAMSEQEQGLAGDAKRKWVTSTAKQVGKRMHADFQRKMKGKHLNLTATEAGLVGAECNDSSSSALPLACPPLPMPTTMVAEPSAIASIAPSSSNLPLLPFGGAVVGNVDDSSEALSGFEEMLAEFLQSPGVPNLPDQQSSFASYEMQYLGFAQLLEDPPSLREVGTVPDGIEQNSEPELNPSPSFQQDRVLADASTENIDGMVFLPQSVPELQQLLMFQKKCLEDNARQVVHLEHQLKAFEIQNSKLQREKEQLRTENESLRSRLEQVAKAQVATWTGIMIDTQQRD